MSDECIFMSINPGRQLTQNMISFFLLQFPHLLRLMNMFASGHEAQDFPSPSGVVGV